MSTLFCLGIIGAIFYIILILPEVKRKKNREELNATPTTSSGAEESSFRFVPLLTNNEQRAYHLMKPYAAGKGLQICPKIRLADLIEPKPNENRAIWQKHFNMICSKHIDFALCDQDMNVKVIIELDDKSHNRSDRQARDRFVNAVLKNSGYRVIHIRTFDDAAIEMLNAILEPAVTEEQQLAQNYPG